MNLGELISFRWLILGSISWALLISGSAKVSLGQKLDRNRPAVYITFKEFVEKTAEDYPSHGARLTLHNNTRWPIYYGKWIERTLPGDVPMIYNIVLVNGCPEERKHVEVVMTGKLMPGKTVSFVVPRYDFPKGSKIYLIFDYSWELRKGERVQDEATHQAYFLASDLPAWPWKEATD